jgi:hypothetical protein
MSHEQLVAETAVSELTRRLTDAERRLRDTEDALMRSNRENMRLKDELDVFKRDSSSR